MMTIIITIGTIMEMKTDNETQGHGVIIAKRPGHTKDVCWDIHDKPPDWK